MAEYGFWNLAQQDPSHLALVTPEGEELTAGALLGRKPEDGTGYSELNVRASTGLGAEV